MRSPTHSPSFGNGMPIRNPTGAIRTAATSIRPAGGKAMSWTGQA